jgi:hypothetical protein
MDAATKQAYIDRQQSQLRAHFGVERYETGREAVREMLTHLDARTQGAASRWVEQNAPLSNSAISLIWGHALRLASRPGAAKRSRTTRPDLASDYSSCNGVKAEQPVAPIEGRSFSKMTRRGLAQRELFFAVRRSDETSAASNPTAAPW